MKLKPSLDRDTYFSVLLLQGAGISLILFVLVVLGLPLVVLWPDIGDPIYCAILGCVFINICLTLKAIESEEFLPTSVVTCFFLVPSIAAVWIHFFVGTFAQLPAPEETTLWVALLFCVTFLLPLFVIVDVWIRPYWPPSRRGYGPKR